MSVEITAERPDSAAARELIDELEADLSQLYPAESRHGFSVERLVQEGVAFFMIRCDGVPAGCGGVKFFGSDYAEVKRMYIRPGFRGEGLGRRMLEHLESFARAQGVYLLRLETGIYQRAAMNLYERAGFVCVGPFGDYRDDPLSRFYEKRLEAGEAGTEVDLQSPAKRSGRPCDKAGA